MEKDEILRAYREGLDVWIPPERMVKYTSLNQVNPGWVQVLSKPCQITKISFDSNGNFCIIEIGDNTSRAVILDVDFELLAFYTKKTSNPLFCSCIAPNKMHNIGAGTLDFYVCKKCHKEVK